MRVRAGAGRGAVVSVAAASVLAVTATVLPASAADLDEVRGVLLVGVAGLDWEDVTVTGTPSLAGITADYAVGSLTVRTVRPRTCVVDGWLTVSAGRRSADVPADHCRAAPQPVPASTGDVTAAEVPGWAELVASQDHGYSSVPGLLGDTLASAGVCATAVGPGAALALADGSGRVERYVGGSAAGDPATVARVIPDCPLTIVDAGSLPSDESALDAGDGEAGTAARAAALRSFDTFVGALLRDLPDGYLLLVAGVSDSGPTETPEDDGAGTVPPAGLRAAMMAGDDVRPRWLTASSTRWTGLVQLTDLTPTLIAAAGAGLPEELVGSPWRESATAHPGSATTTLSELRALDRAAQIFRTQSGPFFRYLGFGQLLLYGAALGVLRLRRPGRVRDATLGVVYGFSLLAAALPASAYLANVGRWWHAPHPGQALWVTVVGVAAIIAVLATAGPWRRRLYGPPVAIAGLTAGILAVDVFSGSHLQHASLLGLSPLVAGRFYGLGNIPFAVFAVSVLVVAAAAAQWVLDRKGDRRAAAAAVIAVGAAGVVVDGAPAGGADFGGVLALLPGVAVLAVGVAGWRMSVRRVLAIGALSVAAVSAIAVLDWLRAPEQRSHLGDFVADVLAGSAGDTLGRKVGASLGSLDTSPYGWLVPAGVVVVALMTANPRKWRARGLEDAIRGWPTLRPMIFAALVTGVVGFAVNDSGIIVPAIVFTAGIPLVVSAVVRARMRGPAAAGVPTRSSAWPAARP